MLSLVRVQDRTQVLLHRSRVCYRVRHSTFTIIFLLNSFLQHKSVIDAFLIKGLHKHKLNFKEGPKGGFIPEQFITQQRTCVKHENQNKIKNIEYVLLSKLTSILFDLHDTWFLKQRFKHRFLVQTLAFKTMYSGSGLMGSLWDRGKLIPISD